MANYPYISGQSALVAAVTQLRKSVPTKVDASYLQRFQIAPANESYVISIFRFLGLIDEDGNRVEDNTGYFYGHDDSFKEGLKASLRSAYSPLFGEMGDEALEATRTDLVHWFRGSDKTSELVGKRQASTFQTLAALAGYGEVPSRGTAVKRFDANPRAAAKAIKTKRATKKSDEITASGDDGKVGDDSGVGSGGGNDNRTVKNGLDVGLSVRIEVNLPPGGDADTYDAIFASIKKHLMS